MSDPKKWRMHMEEAMSELIKCLEEGTFDRESPEWTFAHTLVETFKTYLGAVQAEMDTHEAH